MNGSSLEGWAEVGWERGSNGGQVVLSLVVKMLIDSWHI